MASFHQTSQHSMLCSMLPSLFLKSVWYAASTGNLVANFRSLVWGVGWRGNPKEW